MLAYIGLIRRSTTDMDIADGAMDSKAGNLRIVHYGFGCFHCGIVGLVFTI